MTAQAHAVAIEALLDAVVDPKGAFEYDAVPSPRPTRYIEFGISRRFGGEPRTSSRKATTGYRLSVRAVADTIKDARTMHEKARAALEGIRVTVDGRVSTPIQFETEEEVGPDDGKFSGHIAYTYTIA